jgi:hypothetical protein
VSKMKTKTVILLSFVLFLSYCGKKGPLVLEPLQLPPAILNLQLRQVGSQVELSWKFPTLLADNKTSLLMGQLRGVYIHHMDKPFVADGFQKKSELLAKLKSAELLRRGDGITAYALDFKAKLLKDKEHAFAVSYQYGRTHSALSAIAKITTRTPPEPVRDLRINREGKATVLSWSRPQTDSEKQPLKAITGYKVYRRIVQGKVSGNFSAINPGPVGGEYYEDRDTGVDGEYEYQVSTLLAENIESSPSNVAKTMVQDTFPPDVPANLVAFTAKDHIFLTWEAGRDPDLDHYVVYRKTSEDEDFKLPGTAVTDNFFHDKQITKGQMYIYAVAAVDKKGNESEPCRPVTQLFE